MIPRDQQMRGDPLYQHVLLPAEKKFWRCLASFAAPSRRGRMEGHPMLGRNSLQTVTHR